MQRRDFMKTAGGAALFAAGLGLGMDGAAQRATKPNIIYVLADDLGYGDLGCYGQEVIKTPCIDRMAAEGLKFTEHYAGSTVCAPSRACLLTGKHTGHVHVRGNGDITLRPSPKDITVAERLQAAGYHTAMIGKASVGCNGVPPELPNEKGFDYFFGYLNHVDAHHYFPERLYRNGEEIAYPDNELHEGTHYSHDLFYEDVMRYLDEHQEGPFFLHWSMQIPHASLYAPEEWKAMYRSQFEEEPVVQRHYRSEPEPRTTFAAMVSRMDWEVGQLLDKLKELGIAENTLVIFTSDNGAMHEGGHDRFFFDSSGPLRGGKRDLYEGGIRVPHIAWWPGTVTPGTETAHTSAFWDFKATACDLADTAMPEKTDGISFLPTLCGRADAQDEHEYLYWEFHEQGGKRALRFGNWKAVQLSMSQRPFEPIELYDLDTDLAEENDLAAEHPDIVAQAEALFAEARTRCDIEQFNFPV